MREKWAELSLANPSAAKTDPIQKARESDLGFYGSLMNWMVVPSLSASNLLSVKIVDELDGSASGLSASNLPIRPISLLPVLSKLAEKVILARLNDHLERENILIPEQHGFRPRLSTSHQLLRVVEFIKEGNNKDECTAAVFLDIQKAFDRQTQKPRHTSRKYQRTSSSPGDLVLRVEDCLKLFQNGSGFLFKRKPPLKLLYKIKEYPGLNTRQVSWCHR
ncbi:putative RNA-directed DNA polymerase from transposon BS [Trichonephila clavipes]|nr:putative RNA-directed DNA polymerase from transposon BS [Trichonephila clavipes]